MGVTSGNHSVSETGTNLGNYHSSVACVLDGTTTVVASGSGTSLANIPVNAGDDVVCTITNLLNRPPVANDDSYTATEDVTLSVTAPGVLANDADADGDTLTAVLDSSTSNGTLTLNSDGSFSYEPDENYCGPDSFTYHANDGQAGSNVATANITVECVDDPPTVSVDVPSQTVQYSDIISTVTVTASDTDSHPLNISDNAPSALSTSGSCTPDSMGGTNCTWTLNGQVLVAAAIYNITFDVSDETSDVTASAQVEVHAEDADVSFDSGNPVSVMVESPGGDSAVFWLTVDVTETEPDQAAGSAAPGDIGLANVSMTLTPVGPGGSSSGACTPDGVGDTGYDAVFTVTCTFEDVPVNTYTVEASVAGGYFTGFGEDVLTVYDPSLGFTTGGGWFYWPGTTERTNFGYTMKYNKKGTNLKGSLLLIRHLPDGSTFRLKSNALHGLALNDEGTFGWATFSGKATYKGAGWPEPEGNYSFTVYVEHHDEPGTGSDRFWIEVRDKDGNIVVALSMTSPAQTNAQTLAGGNIVVPHGGGGNGKEK